MTLFHKIMRWFRRSPKPSTPPLHPYCSIATVPTHESVSFRERVYATAFRFAVNVTFPGHHDTSQLRDALLAFDRINDIAARRM